jgi:hypothetical protein
MRQRVSQQETHQQAIVAFRKRIDIGLLNGIANSAMEPLNPFWEKDKRRPKRGIILFLLLFGFFIVSFVYFNFVR